MKNPKVMLLGSIPKGDDVRSGWTDWKVEFVAAIKAQIPDAQFVDGDAISDNAGAVKVVGHDLSLVKRADICIVDGRRKLGAGTAQEIVIAKYLCKPVVIVIPKDTHHRRSNVTFHGVTVEDWIHPFMKVSCDFVADGIAQAAEWAKAYASNPKAYSVKDMSVFDDAIRAFETDI